MFLRFQNFSGIQGQQVQLIGNDDQIIGYRSTMFNFGVSVNLSPFFK